VAAGGGRLDCWGVPSPCMVMMMTVMGVGHVSPGIVLMVRLGLTAGGISPGARNIAGVTARIVGQWWLAAMQGFGSTLGVRRLPRDNGLRPAEARFMYSSVVFRWLPCPRRLFSVLVRVWQRGAPNQLSSGWRHPCMAGKDAQNRARAIRRAHPLFVQWAGRGWI
jgi:hypothetical protein